MATEVHGLRRVWRWIKRGMLGVLGLIAIAIIAGLIFIHTAYGRDKLRAEAEVRLRHVFLYGASIGKLEGSPFGELIVRDLVVYGPDHRPAAKIATLRLSVGILDLFRHQVDVSELIAEDVEIDARRDANGRFELDQLLRPRPQKHTNWSIDIPAIAVRRAHVMIDSGEKDLQVVDLDDLDLSASLHIPSVGARTLGIRMSAIWRERRAPVSITLSIRQDTEQLAMPSLGIHVGGVELGGSGIQILTRTGNLPSVGGRFELAAPRAALAALIPRIDLPADVTLSIDVQHGVPTATPIAMKGTVGTTPIDATAVVNLDVPHASGKLTAGDVDLATYTHGKLAGTVAGSVDFDATPGASGELPSARLEITGHAAVGGFPRAQVTGSIVTHGQHVSTAIAVSGTTRAKLDAELERTATGFTLQRSHLAASTRDPAIATGGKAAIHGSLAIDVTARGQLSPSPDLAVAGAITGAGLRMHDAAIGSLHGSFDATQVPGRPRGKANARMTSVVRGGVRLRELAIDAATRADDRIEVIVGSKPLEAPWIVELTALVTPPRHGSPLVVDLERHHVRTGNGVDWSGTTGHIAIGRARIEVRDLATASSAGTLAVTGTFDRNAETLVATADARHLALTTLRAGEPGTVDGHLDINARPGSASVSITASSPELGNAKLALDVAAPSKIEDVAAWKRRGREAIRSAQLDVQHVDVGPVAAFAGVEAAGHVDGKVILTATTASGELRLRGLLTPPLLGLGAIDADLALGQTAPGELDPILTVRVPRVGKAVARARIMPPARMLDPAAWRALGTKVVREASLETDRIAVDPGLLDRLHIRSTLRGNASIKVTLADGATAVRVSGVLDNVRGSPIVQPVNLRVDAAIDGTQATAALAMTTRGQATTLLQLSATVPITLPELRANPRRLRSLPLAGTLDLPSSSAKQLLAVFGRTEVTAGTLTGKVTFGGTIGNPTIAGRVVAENLAMPPGPRGKPVQIVEQLVVVASWADRHGKLAIDGTEGGGGKLAVRLEGSPTELAAATGTITATHFDMTPLLVFAPGPAGASRGTLDANLTATGLDPRTSRIAGDVHIRRARIPLAPTVGTLRDANIDIAIHPHDIAIKTTGKLGAGTVKLDGTIALDGASLTGGKLAIALRKVSPIGAIEPVIDADVTAKLSRTDNRLQADVTIDHGFVKVSTTTGEKLKPVGTPKDLVIGRGKRAASKQASAPPVEPVLVVNVTLHDTKVESAELRTTIRGQVALTADAHAVGIVGTIEGTGGDVDLFDRRYRVDRAAVHFDGTPDPILDIRVLHDFADVTTITEVRGRLSKPQLALASEPGTYSQSQLLGFLLGGEPGGDPNSSSARSKATDAGASLVANQIGGYVKQALPIDIDVIRYEGASSTSSAAITVGSWISHTLFFAYRQHLGAKPDENTGEGTLEYWISRRLEIQATAGDRGYDGVDALWRKRF